MTQLLGRAAVVVFALAPVLLHSQPAQAPPNARALLERVQQTYRGLGSYHFEHTLKATWRLPGGQTESIVDVTFVTASEMSAKSRELARQAAASPTLAGSPLTAIPFNVDRMRVEFRSARATSIAVVDGQSAIWYSPLRMEYIRGASLRDVGGSVTGAGMLAAPNMMALALPPESLVTDARVAGEEPVDIGGRVHRCLVLELSLAAVPPTAIQADRPPTPLARDSSQMFRLSALLTMFATQGVTDNAAFFYLPPTVEGPAPTLTLWIDAERHLVLRRRHTETVSRLAMSRPKPGEEPSAVPVPENALVELTATFSLAEVNVTLPAALFHLEPPAGAKEIQGRRRPPSAP